MQTSFCPPSSSRLSRTALSIALSAALAALCASNVQAAETALPEVVVSGAAAGAQSWAQWQSAIDLAQRRAATNDTASLLLGIPGLSVNAAGGVSGLPQYNGLSDDNLNIQLDGMGLIASCPNHMNPVLSYASPSQVQSITVYPAGMVPVSVGGDAIGGARLAWKGSDQLFEIGLGYQDVPYQLYPNQRMDMLGNTEKRINLHWLKQFGWGSLDARAYHETVDHFMDFGADKRFWYGSQTMQGGVGGYPCSPISPSCAAGMPMYSQSRTTGVKLQASIDLSAQDVLRTGVELQRYHLDDYWTPSGGMMWPGTFLNVNDGKRDRIGVWGEWQKQLSAEWQTLAGLRVERVRTDAGPVHGYANSNGMGTMMNYQLRDATAFNTIDRARTDTNVDASLLSRWTLSPTQDLSVGLSHTTRSPSLYQRDPWSTWSMAAVMNNFVGDGNGYIGNPNLKPEKATTLSASFDLHSADRAWAFTAQPFYTHVSDYIDVVQWNAMANAPQSTPLKNQFVVLKYVNQTARLYGLNLSGKMPLGDGPLGRLGLQGVVNYTRGENTTTGDNLYAIMPLNARFSLTQQLGGWNNALEWVLVKAKTQVSAVRNEIPTGGYGLLNLRTSYSFKQVRVDFGIDNLLDKFYALPTGGAYVGQGTTMSINGLPWGIAVPGPGRSVYARVGVKF